MRTARSDPGETPGRRTEWADSLLERDAALGAGQFAIDSAAQGVGGLLAITGPAGIGRSALLASLGGRSAESGTVGLRARCAPGERGLAFGAVIQLFEQHVADLGEPEIGSLYAGRARLAARMLMADDVRGGGAVTQEPAASLRLTHALYRLTVTLASKRPLTLMVDDLQWADPESLLFFRYLAPRLAGTSASLVFTVRDGGAIGSEAAVSELIGADHARIERLAPLGQASVRELVARQMGTCSPGSAATCHRLTGGNPWLLHELISAALESGLSLERASADEICQHAPDRVRHRVLAEISGMPVGAHEVAKAAAVLGSTSERLRVTTMTNLPNKDFGGAIDALERAGILDSGNPVGYVHPLVRAAVYSQIPCEERAQLHARAAVVLQAEDADPAAVAAHLLHTHPGGQQWVVGELWRAARAAREHGEFDRAALFLKRALSEPPTAEAEGGLLIELGGVAIERGDFAHAVTLLTRAAEIAHEPERNAAALGLGRALSLHGDGRGAAALLGRAIQESGHTSGAARNELEAGWLAAALIEPALRPEAGRRIERINAVEARHDSPSLLAMVACHMALTGGSKARAADLAVTALAGRSIEGQPAGWAAALQTLCWCGEIERAGVAAAELAARDSVQRSRRALATVRLAAAHSGHLAGRLGDAERNARAACTLIGDGIGSDYHDCAHARLASITLDRGDAELAEAAIETVADEPNLQAPVARAQVLVSRARIHAARHRHAEAFADAIEAGRLLAAAGIENPSVCSWRSQAAVAAAALRDRDQADRLAREELRLARRFGAAPAIGVALTGLAGISTGRKAVDGLIEAEAVLSRSEARLEHARTLTYLGAAFRHHGSQKQARATLRRGLEAAARLDAGAIVRLARSELRSAGARPRSTATSGAAALTASERRVADLAASGLTNREIAQELYVTKKTVEWHLHNVFRKLEVDSRTELRGALSSDAAVATSPSAGTAALWSKEVPLRGRSFPAGGSPARHLTRSGSAIRRLR